MAYWLMSAFMASMAARFRISGAGKSGNPWDRLTALCIIARRVISRITDSVNCVAFCEIGLLNIITPSNPHRWTRRLGHGGFPQGTSQLHSEQQNRAFHGAGEEIEYLGVIRPESADGGDRLVAHDDRLEIGLGIDQLRGNHFRKYGVAAA